MYQTDARQPTLRAEVTPRHIAGSVICTGPKPRSIGGPVRAKNGQRTTISSISRRTNFSAKYVLDHFALDKNRSRKMNDSRRSSEYRLVMRKASTLRSSTATTFTRGSSRWRTVLAEGGG